MGMDFYNQKDMETLLDIRRPIDAVSSLPKLAGPNWKITEETAHEDSRFTALAKCLLEVREYAEAFAEYIELKEK